MSIKYCENCDNNIDLDKDVEHEEMCCELNGKTKKISMKNIKQILDKAEKGIDKRFEGLRKLDKQGKRNTYEIVDLLKIHTQEKQHLTKAIKEAIREYEKAMSIQRKPEMFGDPAPSEPRKYGFNSAIQKRKELEKEFWE